MTYTPEMLANIKTVEATRQQRLGQTFPSMSMDDRQKLLNAFHPDYIKAGFREVRIIHGKGTGMLRSLVHACLQGNPLIQRFYQAPPEAGGWGATIAVLR